MAFGTAMMNPTAMSYGGGMNANPAIGAWGGSPWANGNAGNYGYSSFGAPGQLGSLGQPQQTSALMNQMFTMMGMLMQMMMLNNLQSMMSMGSPSFGGGADSGNSATSGIGDFLGGGTGNANSAVGGADAASATGNAANGDPAKAVEIARKYMGQRSGSINNLPGFTRTGQANNNCAEFVSACLNAAGVYKKRSGDASVATLKQHLLADGWKIVPKQQSKPGDVAIFNSRQHVELVSAAGGKEHIGSNNRGGGDVQYVGTDAGNWGQVEYLSKG